MRKFKLTFMLVLLYICLCLSGCSDESHNMNTATIPEWQRNMPMQYISMVDNSAQYDIAFTYTHSEKTDSLFFSIKSITEKLNKENSLIKIDTSISEYPKELFTTEAISQDNSYSMSAIPQSDLTWIKYHGCTPQDKDISKDNSFVLFLDKTQENMIVAIEDESSQWDFYKAAGYAEWFNVTTTLISNAEKIDVMQNSSTEYYAIQNGLTSTNIIHTDNGGFALREFIPVIIENANTKTVSNDSIPIFAETKLSDIKNNELPQISDKSSLYTWCRYYSKNNKSDMIIYCENNGMDLFVATAEGNGRWALSTVEKHADWFRKGLAFHTSHI